MNNRMKVLSSKDDRSTIGQRIVEGLINMFDKANQIVKAFKMARDHFE